MSGGAKVRLVYNRLVAKLREKGGERRRMDLTVQAYDEGVAFRYTLFGGIEAGERFIEEELTAYRVPPTAKAFIGENVQGFLVGSQECVHRYAPVTEIKPDGWTLMPLVLTIGETDSLALASACLVDYPCSCVTWRDGAIRTHLAPTVKEAGPGGVRARFTDRFDTPWRVILAAGGPEAVPEAMKIFEEEIVPYEEAARAAAALVPSPGHPMEKVIAVRREWTRRAIRQYQRAAAAARGEAEP